MANKIYLEDPVFDNVNNPAHYCEGRAYEPIDVINDWELGFNLGNVVKYISRAGRKNNAIEDLRKARFYLNHQINILENLEEENDGNTGRMDVEMGHRSEQIIYGHNVANNKDWIEIDGRKFEEV